MVFKLLGDWRVGIEVNRVDVSPLARVTRPAFGLLVAGVFVDAHAAFEQRTVHTGMTLCRGNEANGTVAMFVVVPMGEVCDPSACSQQLFKRPDRRLGSVFQGPEC